MKVVVCQGCGSIADRQSDRIMNGSDRLFACRLCGGSWEPASEDSSSFRVETMSKSKYAKLLRKTQQSLQENREIAAFYKQGE